MQHTITFIAEDDTVLVLNTCWTICPYCSGEGQIGNPAFDGISPDGDDYDDDFYDDYFSGKYDITCSHCEGKGMLQAVDRKNNNPKLLRKYYKYLDTMEHLHDCEDAERRAGC